MGKQTTTETLKVILDLQKKVKYWREIGKIVGRRHEVLKICHGREDQSALLTLNHDQYISTRNKKKSSFKELFKYQMI